MPSSKNYKRNYKQEDKYEDDPVQVKRREERNQARLRAVKRGLVHKGDGMDIDHIKPLSKGGSNAMSNTRKRTASQNRSYPRTSKGKMK